MLKYAIFRITDGGGRHFAKRQAQTAEDIDWNYIWFADIL